MDFTGTIKLIGKLETGKNDFQKRQLVLLTEEQYPQPISIEFLKEKGDLLNQLKEGDKVKVSINIGGREWTSPQGDVKYFNSITGWKVEKVDSNDFNEPTSAKPADSQSTASKTDVFAEEDDDLPF